jgi:endonuclease/exonuclease/phosphatase family metal-dependent hydrolase
MGGLKRIAVLALSALLSFAGVARADDQPMPLKIMIFNIWLGGDQVNLTRTYDAVRAADPDILLLQEPEGKTRVIADALGYAHAAERWHMVSRYPIFDAPAADADYALVEVQPGRFVAMANIHLTSDPYGPYAVREGKAAEEVLALETETRLPEIQIYIDQLTPVAASGIPAFIGGDFNAPSRLDWTEAAVGQRPHLKYALDWPVSKALADAGFRDSYREIRPDPVANPGITWSSGYPVPHLLPDEAVDRIDQIHALGNSTTTASQIVGESGGPDIGIGIDPWPSDHHALVSSFTVTPAAAPAMVSFAKRSVAVGDELGVRFHAATDDGRIEDGHIALVASGGKPEEALLSMGTNNGTDRSNVAYFGTAALAPGSYDAVLTGADGAELARAPFWITAPGALPALTVDKADYTAGEPITVKWQSAPGHRRDWLGIYKGGDPDQWNYLAFIYTYAAPSGEAVFDEAAIGGPLEGGEYEVRLMRDDAYMMLGTVKFSVSAPP